MRPAWMSRGIGVNKEILGETRGDLVKPGLTQADLDELENKVQCRSDSPDPLSEFFNARHDSPGPDRHCSHDFDDYAGQGVRPAQQTVASRNYSPEPGHQRACDVDAYARQSASQRQQMAVTRNDVPELGYQHAGDDDAYGRHSARRRQQTAVRPMGRYMDAGDSGDFCQVLVDLARHALSEGGFMQGHRLGEMMNRKHRDLVDQAKAKFGSKGWIKSLLLDSDTDIKVATVPQHGGPCFYLDEEGKGEVPSHPAPPIISGDRIPAKGNAKVIREQRKRKQVRCDDSLDPSPALDRCNDGSPEPEICAEPTLGRSAECLDCSTELEGWRAYSPEPELLVEPTDGQSMPDEGFEEEEDAWRAYSPEPDHVVESTDGRSMPDESFEQEVDGWRPFWPEAERVVEPLDGLTVPDEGFEQTDHPEPKPSVWDLL